MDEWIDALEDEIEFITPSPKVSVESFLEGKGFQHLRQILEAIDGQPKEEHKNSRPAERD